jgi:hypothetical protein
MTSQNSTLRCAASIMYSIAGPNAASGGADVAIEDGRSRLDGIVFILFVVSVPGVSG